MSNDDKQDRIDDYLLGRGNQETRRELEEEITRDAELSEQLAATELAMDAIELAEDEALKARLQALERSARDATPTVAAESTAVTRELPAPGLTKAGVRPRRSWRRLYAVAAAVLMLLLAGWFVLRPTGYDSPAALAMDTFRPYENLTQSGVRGAAEEAGAAYAAYDAADYISAANRLAALPQTATNKFYLGQSLLATQNYTGAAAQFEDVRKMDFGLAQEAEYYLALSRLGEDDVAAARELLETIVASANHPSGAEAKLLLERLDEL